MDEEEYFIDFDTDINPGKLDATRVRLDVVTIADMQKPLTINLCDHPLYRNLVRYVNANPLKPIH